MKTPSNLKYSTHDEWVRLEGGKATVGITDYAQDALGELVHVELPAVGKRVKVGELVCEIESVKAVAEVYAPVGGVISAVNQALADDAASLNRDPYGAWIYELDSVDEAGANLLSADAYSKLH